MSGITPGAALATSIAAIVVALIGGYFGWRNSGQAVMSADQRAWLQTALDEARKAKAESIEAEKSAARASRAANEATQRADDAERRLTTVTLQTEDLIGWISRVVRVAHEVDVEQVDNPAVLRLIQVVNGGPPTLSTDKLRVPR